MKKTLLGLSILWMLVAPATALAAPKCKDKSASDLYDQGAAAYNLGKYEDAIAKWEGAYLKCDDPGLLFNLGQANRKAEHYARARDLYKAWLRDARTKDDPDRQLVKKKIAELDELLAKQKQNAESPPDGVRTAGTDVATTGGAQPPTNTTDAATTNTAGTTTGKPENPNPEETKPDGAKPTSNGSAIPQVALPPPHQEEPRARWYSDGWGWVLTGSGVAAVVVGGIFYSLGNKFEKDARSHQFEDEAAGLFDDADTTHTVGAISLIGGGALVVGGIAHFVVYDRSHRRSTSGTSVAAGPGWISFSWSF
jgi:tetratricopeptide (TPR) repeat protein